MSGASDTDLLGERRLIGLREIAVVPSAEVESGVALLKLGDGALEDSLMRAEDVHPVAPTLRKCEHFEHELDSRDALRNRNTEEPRGPHHRLPVGVDELAPLNDPLETLVAAKRHKLGCVDGHELRGPT